MTPSPGDSATVARLPSWPERNQQWLAAAITRLRQSIEAQTAPNAVSDDDPGFTPALLRCARVFGLSPFERELLLLVAGLELDHGLRTVVMTINGGTSSRASFALGSAFLAQPHWDALSPQSPLRYWRLIEPEPGLPLAQAPLRIDERVLHFITGVAAGDERLEGMARYIDTSTSPGEVDRALAERIARALTEDARSPIIVLHGEPPDPSARRDLALAAASCARRPALWIGAHDLPPDPADLAMLARRIDREAILTGAVPLLSIDPLGAELAGLGLVGRLRNASLWLGPPNGALTALPQPRCVLRFEIPRPDAARTRAALAARWRSARPLTAADDATTLALDRAAGQFHLGSAALDDIILKIDGIPAGVRSAAIWAAAREAARGGLNELAQRIVTRTGFDDLVLPPGQLSILHDIARQLRQRDRVYRDWGFADKNPRGQGLTALFAGESGTGKTLAAEAIANDVELDLYRVDLATLVSKYIGETEKNLKRLFDAAEASGAVLLFDEADALFGKRSEVKDSHDRYANIEVAYLLQRIEAYRGLAILTTNMKSALDRAFLRRICFVVNFPFPDVAARERIWRLQFPPRAPLGAIDFAALARLNLAGGHIRSIALNAAFKAADAGNAIDQPILMAAARAEFAKLERSFSSTAQGT
jgi:ATPase family protein associated with various cellular activities (AAA)/winged helix domain-containing protein